MTPRARHGHFLNVMRGLSKQDSVWPLCCPNDDGKYGVCSCQVCSDKRHEIARRAFTTQGAMLDLNAMDALDPVHIRNKPDPYAEPKPNDPYNKYGPHRGREGE